MPTKNIEVFGRFFEAMFNGRTEEALELIDVGFSYINPPDAIEPGIRHGREGLRTVIENYADAYSDTDFTITRITEEDHEVVATIVLVARSRTSGMGVENRTSWLCTFRRGKVLRVEYFNDPDQAWEATAGRQGKTVSAQRFAVCLTVCALGSSGVAPPVLAG